MNFKILKIGVAVPVFALGMLGYIDSARAADFTIDSQLNIAGALQVNGGFADGDITTEDFGDGDSFADIIFAPTLPQGFDGSPVTMFDSVNAGNRVLDVDAMPTRDATVGDLGEIIATAGNTGAFSGISAGDLGLVRDFDASPDEVFDFSDDGFFLEIDNFRFSLDVSSVVFEPLGLAFFDNAQTPGNNAEVEFDAVGEVIDLSDMTTSKVRYDFTAQFLFDSAEGGDPVANDFITGIGSVSGSIIAEDDDIDIPEPSALLGMLVLGGGFLSQSLLGKKAKVRS